MLHMYQKTKALISCAFVFAYAGFLMQRAYFDPNGKGEKEEGIWPCVFDFSTILVHVNGSYIVFVKHVNKFHTKFRSAERLTTLLDGGLLKWTATKLNLIHEKQTTYDCYSDQCSRAKSGE